MKTGTVVNLTKKITTQNGGLIACYALTKGFSIPVLVLASPNDAEMPEVKAAMAALQKKYTS